MLYKEQEFWRKKHSFYDDLKCEWDMHSAHDLVMRTGDFNIHNCRHIDGFHRGHSSEEC